MSSHRILNYSLRPAKNIERKMICEVLQRLIHFGNLNKYQYVGLGSRYFSDFSLIHKNLGIKRMISIEKDIDNKDWFEFNRPYKCITPIYDHTNNALPKLKWDSPTILWLDYDGHLSKTVFTDIMYFCSNAVGGSLLLITVNATAQQARSEEKVRALINEVGEDRVPRGTHGKDLSKKEKPKVLRKIIDNEIQEKLSIRNGVLPFDQKINYQQLFNFVYEDGAQMLTVGGIIYTNRQKQLLNKCHFIEFEFYKPSFEQYSIFVPNLTFREIHHLNKSLPLKGSIRKSFIPNKEIEQYAKVYRYFPTFTEAEV